MVKRDAIAALVKDATTPQTKALFRLVRHEMALSPINPDKTMSREQAVKNIRIQKPSPKLIVPILIAANPIMSIIYKDARIARITHHRIVATRYMLAANDRASDRFAGTDE